MSEARQMTSEYTLLDAALQAYDAGLCVLPPKQDGTKAPFSKHWKKYQTQRPSREQVKAWVSDERVTGLGLVCGEVSGGLEVLDFDNLDAYTKFCELAYDAGLQSLVERIEAGYLERTVNGVHWLWRCEEIEGNLKLARRANSDGEIKVLVETRGEGGYIICAPSHGDVHPTKQPYRLVKGSFGGIVTLSPEERAEILNLARTLDELPRQARTEAVSILPTGNSEALRPGDWWNETKTWAEILNAHGWREQFTRDGETYWVRPGKGRGVSATTNYKGSDLLKVFTSSTLLDTECTYTKFGAYTALEHAGDFAAATRAIGALMPKPEVQHKADEGTEAQRHEGTEAHTPNIGRAMNARDFILNEPDTIPALWGDGEDVLWAAGESLIIAGPTGVGKTTIAQQVVLARIGVLEPEVLGYPVAQSTGKVLYIAGDRPRQAARSMKRMIDVDKADLLAERMTVWRGPLEFDAGKEPERLVELCKHFEADLVVIDSLKDIAVGLSADEVGAGVNKALQSCLAEGVEVLVMHHQRKPQQGGGKPKAISDVYGSVWITGGAGSVFVVWGEAGDAVVEMSHLKQPAEVVSTMEITHDHPRGRSTVNKGVDILQMLRGARMGLSARFIAVSTFDTEEPSKAQVENARRRLERLVTKGLAYRQDGAKGGRDGGAAALYFAAENSIESVV